MRRCPILPIPRLPHGIGRLLLSLPLCAALAAPPARAADELRLQRSAAETGPRAVASLRELLALLRRARDLPARAQLQAINDFFNSRIEFATDAQLWGSIDFWASPLQTLEKGAGDCEDFAIAKYFSLLAAGMPVHRLRLVYVRARLDRGQQVAHMVLAYYPADGGDVLVLDNLVDAILPSAQRGDLTPVFSFNSDGLWQGVGGVGAGDPAARLTRWRDLLQRARAEGFE